MDLPRHEADVEAVAHMLNDIDAGAYGLILTPLPEQEVLASLATEADRVYARVLAHAAQERRRDPHGVRAQQAMAQAQAIGGARPADADSSRVITAAAALAVGYAASVRREAVNDAEREPDRAAARGTEPRSATTEKEPASERSQQPRQRGSVRDDFRRAFHMAATAVGPIAADEVEPNLSAVAPLEVAGEVMDMSADVLHALKAAGRCVGRGTASQRRKASARAYGDDARQNDRSHDYEIEREHYQGLTL